jgi:hypothetical protein
MLSTTSRPTPGQKNTISVTMAPARSAPHKAQLPRQPGRDEPAVIQPGLLG